MHPQGLITTYLSSKNLTSAILKSYQEGMTVVIGRPKYVVTSPCDAPSIVISIFVGKRHFLKNSGNSININYDKIIKC